jgi:hypothetical protein
MPDEVLSSLVISVIIKHQFSWIKSLTCPTVLLVPTPDRQPVHDDHQWKCGHFQNGNTNVSDGLVAVSLGACCSISCVVVAVLPHF